MPIFSLFLNSFVLYSWLLTFSISVVGTLINAEMRYFCYYNWNCCFIIGFLCKIYCQFSFLFICGLYVVAGHFQKSNGALRILFVIFLSSCFLLFFIVYICFSKQESSLLLIIFLFLKFLSQMSVHDDIFGINNN